MWRHEIGQDLSKDEVIFEEKDARSVCFSLYIQELYEKTLLEGAMHFLVLYLFHKNST